MTDAPSPILLLRIQSTGSNVNLWGGYINTVLLTLEQASKGYQTLAVTGSATISWTNYMLANTGQAAKLKLTGALSGAAVLTFPAYDNELAIWNAAGATVTIMCSGGVGVAIPNGRKTRLYCDGTDYYSSAPTWIADTTTLTNPGDLVSNAQMAAAIAALVGLTVNGLVLNSTSATVANYLVNLLDITATGAVSGTWTTENAGTSTEKMLLTLAVDGGQIALADSIFCL